MESIKVHYLFERKMIWQKKKKLLCWCGFFFHTEIRYVI